LGLLGFADNLLKSICVVLGGPGSLDVWLWVSLFVSRLVLGYGVVAASSWRVMLSLVTTRLMVTKPAGLRVDASRQSWDR
jgi:hypothetical protein